MFSAKNYDEKTIHELVEEKATILVGLNSLINIDRTMVVIACRLR